MLRGRPFRGIVAAGICLCVPLVLSMRIDSTRSRRVAEEAESASVEAAERARDALRLQLDAVELLAHNAVANPRLVAALRGRVDRQTLADLFASESWWEPYRQLATAISYEGTTIAFAQADGAASGLPIAEVIASVRSKGAPVSKMIAHDGRVFLVSATPIRVSASPSGAVVLVLAKHLDGPLLNAIAERVEGGLLISDGKRALGAGASGEDLRLLQPLVGKEARPQQSRPQDPTWGATAISLGGGLWLWTSKRVAGFARGENTGDWTKKRLLWAAGTLLAIAALAISFRRPAGSSTAEASYRPRAPSLPGSDGVPALPMLAASSQPHGGVPPAAFPTPSGSAIPLGRYMLLDRIGAGGMAEVFTAVSFGSVGFRRTFVVKRLRPEMTANTSAVAHFIDEANLASTLVHPNIVPVFDFGEVGGAYFLAQEYIVGRDLGRLTRRMVERGVPPMTTAAALFVTHEILSGLAYAHQKCGDDGTPMELVHRDITPENVMISERGEVKILDFGIVKAREGRVSQTDIGTVKGNVDFMSPEQARGRSVDHRADLFSVGLVLYYTAAREPLYRGQSLYDRLTQAALGPGAEELERIAALPSPLPEILDRALSVDVDRRFQTAAEFREAVAPFMSGGTELARMIVSLFGAELRVEQDRLAAAFPRARSRDPAQEAK
jgi:hypothetical protein